MFGTSEWWLDHDDRILHIGAGTLTNTDAKFDEQGNTVSWGNIGWHQIANFTDRNFIPIFEGKVKLGVDATGIFAHLYVQDESILSDLIDTSQTQNMSYMFAKDSAPITNYDFKYFDTSHVTNMSNMFVFSRGFVNIDVSNFDTSKVQNMHGMFQALDGLETVNLANLNTSQVTDMSSMFNGDDQLTGLDLSSFDTSRVTDMSSMFAGTYLMTSLNISSFNTSQVTNMARMFSSVQSVATLDVSNLDTSRITDMSGMFWGAFVDSTPARRIVGLEKFKTSQVTNMADMFRSDYMANGAIDGINHFDTRAVTNMSGMFYGITGVPQNWKPLFSTINVQNMSQMFTNIENMSVLDLTKFDTQNVTDMSGMFKNDTELSEVKWSSLFNTSNVTSMALMFEGDSNLQSLDLSNIDMRKVRPVTIPYGISTYVYTLGLFNTFQSKWGDGDPVVKLRQLRLNANSRLAFPDHIRSVDDIADVQRLQSLVGPNESIEQFLLMLLTELKVPDETDLATYSIIQSAGLKDAEGSTGRWLNTRTGETLTADQLMDRYSEKNADLATTDTWIWQNIVGRDVRLTAGKKTTWQPRDSFDQTVNIQGQALALNDLDVTVTDARTGQVVDPTKIDFTQAGEYLVTFSTTPDGDLLQTSGPVRLTVAPNPAVIQVHDSVISLDADWQATDNVDQVIGADGQTIPATVLSVSGTVNVKVPGVYTVQYTFADDLGSQHTATARVIVNGLTLKTQTHTMTTDETWQPLDNVLLAVNDQGINVSLAQITTSMTRADGQVVTSYHQPGDYVVTYQFTDGHGVHQQQLMLTILAGTNHASLNVAQNHVSMYTGILGMPGQTCFPPWMPMGSPLTLDGFKLPTRLRLISRERTTWFISLLICLEPFSGKQRWLPF
nr:BspA family leucine-rich repeat surface protein [Lactiplantibacillus carotarum]